MIRVLIADDHAIVRGGLRQLFSLAGDVAVVAEAGSGGQLMERLQATPCDVVLLDLSMPGACGIELIARVRAHAPLLPILVLSMHTEAAMVRRALKAGANGYLSKDGEPEALPAAVRKVAAGGRYLDPCLAERPLFNNGAWQFNTPHTQLSERELSVLRLLAGGSTVNQIASQLAISNKTVSTHKARLMRKMGFASNADMLRYGISHALGG